MRHEVISSRSNPLVTRLRKLGSKRSARREEGVFVGEGPKLLQEAVRWRIPLETVVYASGVTLPQLPDDVRMVEVPDSLLEAVAQTQTPQGVVFVCRTPALELPEQLTPGAPRRCVPPWGRRSACLCGSAPWSRRRHGSGQRTFLCMLQPCRRTPWTCGRSL